MTWDPVGKYLASQSADKTLRVWRTSDWVEEASVSEPFEECGGTTHVLRLDWSPDGSYLVSAHAMNGGGPTAQILERDGWKFEKDFVGHRKAVTCVRFNDNIFEKDSEGKKTPFVCLAIGSRDRSMSVWVTNLKRPLFVIHDVFESSILDLAWSKDGLVLLACSMDGSVAAVVLSEKELGTPMSKENKTSMLKKVFGQNIGLVQNSKPIMIENPEFLKLTQNGNDSDAMETDTVPAMNGNSKMTNSFPKRGPTDKQLEMMTSDGRRRITPIFILPTAENSVNTSSMNGNSYQMQMQSSSSGAKSNIVIEKLDGIVEPNVSPGKKSGSPVSDNPVSQGSSSPAPRTNMIAIKHKPGPINNSNPAINSNTKVNGTASVTASDSSDSQAKGPPVNMIQVKKAPGKAPAPAPAQTPADSTAKKSEEVSSSSGQVKKKINRIESSSSESDSSDSESSSSSSDDETTSQTSKSGADTDRAGQETSKVKAKPEKPAAKPVILNNKRKIEDSGSGQPPAKKRGRPPGTGTGTVSGSSTPVLKTSAPPVTNTPAPAAPTAPAPTVAVSSSSVSSASPVSVSHSVPGLPPLALVNNRQNVNYSQHKLGTCLLNIFVHNDFQRTSLGNLHKVSSHEAPSLDSPLLWDLILPAPVTAVVSSPSQLVVTCRDATLHLLSSSGSRTLPPAVLPAPPHRLALAPCGTLLACVTTNAKLFLWKLDLVPKIILKNEDIGPLARTNKRVCVTITKITFNSDKLPIISLR